jgi:thioredoxin-related protein
MKIIKYLLLLPIFLFLLSCQKTDKQMAKADALLAEIDPKKLEKGIYLIIPNAGCGGCISDAENVFSQYNHKKELKAIFTAFTSKKGLKIHLAELFYNQNVIVDDDNLVSKKQLLTIYPVALWVENGKVTQLKYFSPEEADTHHQVITYLQN